MEQNTEHSPASIIPMYDYAGAKVAREMIHEGFDGDPNQLEDAVLSELQGEQSALTDEQNSSVRAGVDRVVGPMRELAQLPFFHGLVTTDGEVRA